MADAIHAECERTGALDPRIRNVQPGGGIVFRIEYAWGFWRRWWLTHFRKTYVAHMQSRRRGDSLGVPHPVLDPRDLKLFRNQTDCGWLPQDDPFLWRDRLPFVRSGLAELIVFSLVFWLLAGGLALACGLYHDVLGISTAARMVLGVVSAACVVLGLATAWFFRNPKRVSPVGPGLMVAPADGRVASIETLWDPGLGTEVVEIGIFLSVFNVHINRVPDETRVISIAYQPGKFLNALRPESARENEQTIVCLEQQQPPNRRMVVRQITGAIARRIVCFIKPGDNLQRGEPFGMIKLGSRTVLALPRQQGLQMLVRVGDRVRAGASIVARYPVDVDGG